MLDRRDDPQRIVRVSQMAERARLDAVWIADGLIAPDGEARLEPWVALSIAAMYTKTIRVGLMASTGLRQPAVLGSMAGSLDSVIGGRLELGVMPAWYQPEQEALSLPFPDALTRITQTRGFVTAMRRTVTGAPVVDGSPRVGVASPQVGGPPITLEVRGERQMRIAAEVADCVLLPLGPLSELRGLVRSGLDMCEELGRDPETLSFAAQLPVSVGRTEAESDFRVEVDHLMAQMNTRVTGLHGTLEQCQDLIIELAHIGVADVRCILPNVPDIDDVIAQLSATAVGTKDKLLPGQARSVAPAPPPGWGGPPKPGAGSAGAGRRRSEG
jgi:alkanesulfonate monooxygenase SsuD/methylene tetrahydromethanopterin reductase-like flavin-dependent oxidoreductase (luciferase family)